MNERQKRLTEVYEHLRRYFGIHTKTGFAEALHYGRTSMSAAMNGDENYLTDKLFKNICEVYPDIFNLDYLLKGEGTLLSGEDELRLGMRRIDPEPMQPKVYNQSFEQALADKMAIIEQLQLRLKEKDEMIQEKNERIREKDERILELHRLNDDLRIKQQELNKRNEETISDLQRENVRLNMIIEGHDNSFEKYPFPQGVAEIDNRTRV